LVRSARTRRRRGRRRDARVAELDVGTVAAALEQTHALDVVAAADDDRLDRAARLLRLQAELPGAAVLLQRQREQLFELGEVEMRISWPLALRCTSASRSMTSSDANGVVVRQVMPRSRTNVKSPAASSGLGSSRRYFFCVYGPLIAPAPASRAVTGASAARTVAASAGCAKTVSAAMPAVPPTAGAAAANAGAQASTQLSSRRLMP
jgi:hypothetical protein